MKEKTLYLIDASSFIWRAFYALPLLTNSRGEYVNAVAGFGSMIANLFTSQKIIENNDKVLIVCDCGRETFRMEIYPQYKATRKDVPPELPPQFDIIKELTKKLGISTIEIQGFEADDLIASYARQVSRNGQKVVIVSSDKDLMQLIDDNIKMYDPVKNKHYDVEDVKEKFGVLPSQVVDYQAIAGDSSDNIPGILGLGPKAASELVNQYGNLENILANVDKITPLTRRQKLEDGMESARISYQLALLKDDIELPIKVVDIKDIDFDECQVLEFCDEYELNRLKQSLLNILSLKNKCKAEIKDNRFVSNGYKSIIKKIVNSKEVYIYPFFDDSKISKKRLIGLAVDDGTHSYFLSFAKIKSKDLFTLDDVYFDKYLGENRTQIIKDIFENDKVKKIIYESKMLMHALDNEFGLTINNYEDVHTFLFSVFGLKYGAEFYNISQNLTGKIT
ncbi:MAG: hypothetical protein LBR35_00465, partial [Rickettsiales bacterium]|nr:hypothetical protein [Rickettsiales bacterium]